MVNSTGSTDSASQEPARAAIADRMDHRLLLAGIAFDRRHGAARPNRRKTPKASPTLMNPTGQLDLVHARERACLRIVFRDLGDTHRRYRARTGNTGTPALRAANYAFKAEPSVVSLLPVATFLDELGILAW